MISHPTSGAFARGGGMRFPPRPTPDVAHPGGVPTPSHGLCHCSSRASGGPSRNLVRRLWSIAAILSLAATAQADWRLSPKEVREEVKSVVASQLEAFQREDIPAAYAFAATSIRQQFRLPVYERMIRRGYAPLLRHARAEPGVVRDDGGAMAMLPVAVHVSDGRVVRYRYHLLREDGKWRVSGVMPDLSAPKRET